MSRDEDALTVPGGWSAYYDTPITTAPHPTLTVALDAFDAETATGPLVAVDLGCGQGRDSLELLRRGWRVLAIDSDPDGVARLRRQAGRDHGGRLEVRLGRFEDERWPAADLVNASLTLGWCAADEFARLWDRVVRSLRPGGRFAGQLFGDRDRGGGFPTTTRLSRREVDVLLAGWDVEFFREESVDSMTPFGVPKHRHLYDVVARRR
ncbi:class I SAM-dependent methyltransferase [Pseudonocardia sp. H11422]|uniref:class I SAM-dependent methyltransferase n=1 Tax=Pseudonocardia sp. H11422 TaxID=2835866 RepID=UPI0027E21E1E|nr:class I SAM-dependent methyltransferase [Pseudonocardia sp. H11422]